MSPFGKAKAGDEPPDEPPRLQNTAERDALRLPLPGDATPPSADPDAPATTEFVPPEPAPDLREEAQAQAAVEPDPVPDQAAEAAAPDLRGATGKDPVVDEPAADLATPAAAPPPVAEPVPAAGPAPQDPPSESPPFGPAATISGLTEGASATRPEVLVGAAFAGGVLVALVIRWLRS